MDFFPEASLSDNLMLSYINLSSSQKADDHVLLRPHKSSPPSFKPFTRYFSVEESGKLPCRPPDSTFNTQSESNKLSLSQKS